MIHRATTIPSAVLLLCCGASVAFGSWVRGVDPGGNPEVPYWVRVSTFHADMVVKGIVREVEIGVFSPSEVFTFVSLTPDAYLKGTCEADTITFYLAGPAKRDEWVEWTHPPTPALGIGDTLLAWLENDARGELFNRHTVAMKRGDGAWVPRDEHNEPAHSLQQYDTWVRALTEERTPERLVAASDAIVVGFVNSMRYLRVDRRSHVSAELMVEDALLGAGEGSTIEVVLPAFADPSQRDFIVVQPGERLLLFLEAHGDDAYRVLGGRDGAYAIVDELVVCLYNDSQS